VEERFELPDDESLLDDPLAEPEPLEELDELVASDPADPEESLVPDDPVSDDAVAAAGFFSREPSRESLR
jgi:hypothetical protein